MSKYKVGDKFIIEIADVLHIERDKGEYESPWYECYGIDEFVFDENDLGCLEQYDADAKTNADYNSGYEDGLRDAWECARKLVLLKDDGGVPTSDFEEAFGTEKPEYDIFKDLPVSEVLPKLKEYEAKQRECETKQSEIEVGDEVMGAGETKGIVTNIRKYKMYIVWTDGSSGAFDIPTGLFKKTGRHVDMNSILKQMRGEW